MIIQLEKFGTTLVSRQLGKEALAAFRSSLSTIHSSEKIEIDFHGVTTLAPAWADEFLGALLQKYGARVVFRRTINPSVNTSLRLLEKVHGYTFNIHT